MSAQIDSLSTATEAFLDGVALFATNPDHVLVVLATGLLAGLRGSPSARATCFALPLAWSCGGFVGLTWPASGALRVPLILSFLIVAALVALDRKLAPRVVVALATTAGLLHGYVQGREMAGGGVAWPGVLGAVTVVLVLVFLVTTLVAWLKPAWSRIAVRVAGSWIVAIGLLMLGWLVRGTGHEH